jgi:hypothetical protein
MNHNFEFKVGSVVKDIITNFKGVVVGRTQWLNNCNTYVLKSQKLKDGIPMDTQHFDEPQLILVKDSVFEEREEKTGGPERKLPMPNRL